MNYIIKCKNKKDIKYIAYIIAKLNHKNINNIISTIENYWTTYKEYTYIWVDNAKDITYSNENFVKRKYEENNPLTKENFYKNMNNIKIIFDGKKYNMAKNPFYFYQILKGYRMKK